MIRYNSSGHKALKAVFSVISFYLDLVVSEGNYSLRRTGRAAFKGVASLASLVRQARQLELFLVEIAGVVLVTLGIAQWSWPAALIIGGLVLVVAIEMRPGVAVSVPVIGLPSNLLHLQAASAARAINNARYGVAEVREEDLEKLTDADCDQLIAIARGLGSST